MSELSFIKMHGLGNDFVVVDGRGGDVVLDSARVRAIAERREGVGCDQLLEICPPNSEEADAFMRIWNADGGQVEACGNGTRCVAAFLMAESGTSETVIETVAGLLRAETAGDGQVAVDMGEARTAWKKIPLARKMDTLSLDLALGELSAPVAVNMGNPHAVFFVDDVDAVDLAVLGPQLEVDALFPKRANIGVAHVEDKENIRLRVWERGVGLTQACGSGACAALVAAARRGLTDRRATVTLGGGALEIEWLENNHVRMTGPVATSFMGMLL
ncbi:MAG: Diaminopimelate epimerase [Alphaproteobacteria bacterium MarineAlpha10_Bin1]|nr:MAG: Diaminopimelate epimerase [Alphaproteobacteria bacterium MarineAlpha10_Bin1]